MRKVGLLKKAYIILALCTAIVIDAPAQTFTSLFSFNQPGYNPISGLVQASDGNFYGTTLVGGATGEGTVFKITPDGTLTTLYSFCADAASCSADGGEPAVGLIQSTDGNFYGATRAHGPYLQGTVFKITPAGTLTTMHAFATDGSEGIGSSALLQATDGNFYAETTAGGASTQCSNFGCGTIFQITPAGTLTTLYSFCLLPSCPDGKWPNAGLHQATDGNFYGTTEAGGAYGGGTAFKINPAGTLTTLYSFCSQINCTDGQGPNGLIQGTDGNFYGPTEGGGISTKCGNFGCGTVFQITPAGVLTTLYSFCTSANCADGRAPSGQLIQASDRNFYGTTMQGGTSANCTLRCGTVFEITPGGTLASLHAFNSTDGADPVAGLVRATDGSFYGTTEAGGTYGGGTVFRLTVAPAVRLSSTLLNFGNEALNETSTVKTVTITNSGSALLTISGISSDSTFPISGNTCGAVLGINKSCKVSLTFTPTVLGKLAGTLTFTDNADNNPQTVSLSGTGVEPATLTPASATYPSQAVGTTSLPKTFTLTNNQSVALFSIAISTTGDFSVSATTCTTSLAGRSKCTIGVTFTPTATGTRTGKLIVSDSTSNSPQTSNLTGTGK